MATPIEQTLTFSIDNRAAATYLRNQPPLIVSGTLTASTPQSYTLPTGATGTLTKPYNYYHCFFGWDKGADIYVLINGTAAVPSGALATGGSEVNPVGYWLPAGAVISIVTNAASVNLSIAIYGVQTNGNF